MGISNTIFIIIIVHLHVLEHDYRKDKNNLHKKTTEFSMYNASALK